MITSDFELKVEVAGRVMYGERYTGWGVVDVPGLWDSAETRDEEEVIPGRDGLNGSVEQLLDGITFRVVGKSVATTPQWAADDRAWLRSLAKLDDLAFRKNEAGTWLSLRGARVDGKVRASTDFRGLETSFEIPVASRDPRWYGQKKSFPVDAVAAQTGGLRYPLVDGSVSFGDLGDVSFPGAFRVPNRGTAPYWPGFRVRGGMDSFTIISESHVIAYDAPIGVNQTLTLSPYLGGRAVLDGVDVSTNLLQADWVPVRGGETRGYVFSAIQPTAGAQLLVDYYEGAWW